MTSVPGGSKHAMQFSALKGIQTAFTHAFKRKKSTFPSCFQDARIRKMSIKICTGVARALICAGSVHFREWRERVSNFSSMSNFSSFTHNDAVRASGFGCSCALPRIQRAALMLTTPYCYTASVGKLKGTHLH